MPSFTIPLNPEGDDSAYRLRPEYDGQVEQPNMVDYGTSLHVQADLVEVVHGYMFDGKDLATLIIVDFRFTSTDPSRRFRYAEIIYKFRDSDPSDADPPRIHQIAPDGDFSMNRTEKTRQLTRGANATAGSGFGPANASLGLTWNLVETGTQVDQAHLTGFKKVFERPRPPPQTAWWSLHENPNDRSGIPNFMRAAILLKRKSNDRFRSTLVIKAKADMKYKFQDRSGKLDIAPVDYDPSLPRPTPAQFDSRNLGLIDLQSIMAVQTMTSLPTQDAILPLAAFQSPKIVETTTAMPPTKGISVTETPPVTVTPTDSGVQTSGASNIEPSIVASDNSARSNEVLHPNPDIPIKPSRSQPLGKSSTEETLLLLLHAVRTGVEVLAYDKRVELDPWPEFGKDNDSETPNLSLSSLHRMSPKQGSNKDKE